MKGLPSGDPLSDDNSIGLLRDLMGLVPAGSATDAILNPGMNNSI